MEALGIYTGSDLKAQALPFLQEHFGKAGPYYFWLARGIDERRVSADRVRKSFGAETTFSADLITPEEARAALEPLINKVWTENEPRTSTRNCSTSTTTTPMAA